MIGAVLGEVKISLLSCNETNYNLVINNASILNF